MSADASQSIDAGSTADAYVVAEPCKKVDVLFVVDDSGSMAEEKVALAKEVFPAFARKLLDIGAGVEDYRIGVMDACPYVPFLHTAGMSGPCHFATGERWMDSADPDLEREFACVADIDGSDDVCGFSYEAEQPTTSAAASMEVPFRIGYNAGFLRDDAYLVLVTISDDDDLDYLGETPSELVARLVRAHGGNIHTMVFLAIAPSRDCDGVYGHGLAAPATMAIAREFGAAGQGFFWDLCKGNLTNGLDEAMAVIEAACLAPTS